MQTIKSQTLTHITATRRLRKRRCAFRPRRCRSFNRGRWSPGQASGVTRMTSTRTARFDAQRWLILCARFQSNISYTRIKHKRSSTDNTHIMQQHVIPHSILSIIPHRDVRGVRSNTRPAWRRRRAHTIMSTAGNAGGRPLLQHLVEGRRWRTAATWHYTWGNTQA